MKAEILSVKSDIVVMKSDIAKIEFGMAENKKILLHFYSNLCQKYETTVIFNCTFKIGFMCWIGQDSSHSWWGLFRAPYQVISEKFVIGHNHLISELLYVYCIKLSNALNFFHFLAWHIYFTYLHMVLLQSWLVLTATRSYRNPLCAKYKHNFMFVYYDKLMFWLVCYLQKVGFL